jgi:hypothetical protein
LFLLHTWNHTPFLFEFLQLRLEKPFCKKTGETSAINVKKSDGEKNLAEISLRS